MAVRYAMGGLSAVEYTAIPDGGGYPAGSAVWAKFGNTLEGTCNIDTSDPEVSETFVEESDVAVMSIEKGGGQTLKWTSVDPDSSALVALMGGTYDAETKIWDAPRAIHKSEVAVRFKLKTGQWLVWGRVSVVGKMAGDVTKDGVIGFECTGTVLAPGDGTSAPYKIMDDPE